MPPIFGEKFRRGVIECSALNRGDDCPVQCPLKQSPRGSLLFSALLITRCCEVDAMEAAASVSTVLQVGGFVPYTLA